MRHKAPRAPDKSVGEFWLENPFDFVGAKNANLSKFERNRLFLNRGAKQVFADASYISGTDIDADTRAVAVGDLNGDLRPDLLVRSAGGGPLKVFLNRMTTGQAIKITLKGRASNAQGLGARLRLQVGDSVQYRELFAPNSLMAQSAAEVIFGVGQTSGPYALQITWPSGRVQKLMIKKSGHTVVTEPGQ